MGRAGFSVFALGLSALAFAFVFVLVSGSALPAFFGANAVAAFFLVDALEGDFVSVILPAVPCFPAFTLADDGVFVAGVAVSGDFAGVFGFFTAGSTSDSSEDPSARGGAASSLFGVVTILGQLFSMRSEKSAV